MRFLVLFSFQLHAAVASPYTPPSGYLTPRIQHPIASSTAGTDALAANALANWQAHQPKSNSSCTEANVAVRREWGDLSGPDRKAYTDAVLCLMAKPPRTDNTLVPGAKSRFDDFVWVHMNQSLYIHATANFLTWHRYFLWAYEQALRNECGYQGYHPYWNWGRWAADPAKSPVFDGSEFSFSGNGVFQNHTMTMPPPGIDPILPGEGGGCLASGPFKDSKVNLGPVVPTFNITKPGPPEVVGNGTAYNPRCIKRDISAAVAQRHSSDLNSTNLIKDSPDIATFQRKMGGEFSKGEWGVHAGGHYTFLGDPGGDFFVSPGDPVFHAHHCQLDRIWWIWQYQDIDNRVNVIDGTITMDNTPPSRNGTLDDIVDLGVLAEAILPLKSLTSTTGGPFCYIYK
ncbi:hypothetical protein HYALB_00011596 [Hymenoscyphus albidus]|uniref:Tyrosinase copper-binding domain-containing protein n=1 Tax=Hymenoscyphus albidus TaxID=595503 RepID=A0A9N9LV02_9HELO|nr:hypothetical protein HYALB_00011596 [Hymenoscyphus albidus]